MRFTTSKVAEVTGGEAIGPERVVSGAAVDSRLISGGELFVPLRAARDGHEWIGTALAAGAAAYLTEQPPLDTAGATAVRVADTAAALSALAAAARSRVDCLVVGITGSVGKTTTKDLVRAVLTTQLVTHASPRSFNNEIGVPLTLVNAPEGVAALVVEMGAKAAGHIAALCEVVRPSVGVVTRIAPVHTATFGDIEDVAKAKRELVEALPADGTAVLNADDPRVAAMAASSPAPVLRFGSSAGDVRGEVVHLDDDLRPQVRIETPSGPIEARLSARGAHQLTNALAAVAVGVVAGIDLSATAQALESAELSPLRMNLFLTRRGARVLDDTWNANPASVEAALQSLAALPARHRLAVLGRMAELGTIEAAEHRRMVEVATGLGIEVLAVDAPQYGVACVRIEDVLDRLAGLSEGDAVLIKGSRVAGLDQVTAALRDGV